MTQNIIMGIPPEVSDIAELGYVPYKNGRVVMCSLCDCSCHIGPEQGKKMDAGDGEVVCAKCIIRAQMASGMTHDDIMQWYDTNVTVLTDKKMGE